METYREIPLELFFYDPELPTRTLTDEERIALDKLGDGRRAPNVKRTRPKDKDRLDKAKFLEAIAPLRVGTYERQMGFTHAIIHRRMSLNDDYFYMTKKEVAETKDKLGIDLADCMWEEFE